MTVLAFYDEGPKSAPAVVLGHSLGSNRRVWDEVAQELSQNWRVIRWEMPGHGESGLLQATPSMSAIVTEVLAGLDDLGVHTFHAAGISLGGMVSLALAQTVPGRVITLAMLDSGAALPPPEQWLARATQVRQQGMESLADGTMDRWFTPEFRTGAHADRYKRTLAAFLACDPRGYAQCCEVIASTDMRDGLAAVHQPSLILTGSEDAGMTPQQAAQLAAEIPGASGRYQVINGARHMTCVERPKMVAAALAENLHV